MPSEWLQEWKHSVMITLSTRLAAQLRFEMQPLRKVHFETLEGDLESATHPSILYIMLSAAFLILIIGCTNYINLALSKGTTALSGSRDA